MKINNPIKGNIEYEPYDFQKELIQRLVYENKNVIVKSARQMGVSTTLFYCIRELCLNNPNYKAILVTSDRDGYEGLNRFPDNEHIKHRTKSSIVFNNYSVIRVIPGNPTRGENLDDYEVFFDNYEFISKKLIECLSPCFSENKFAPRFYSFTGNNDFDVEGFETLKWNYDLQPERDENWVSRQREILTESMFNNQFTVV